MIDIIKLTEVSEYLNLSAIERDAGLTRGILAKKIQRHNQKKEHRGTKNGDGRITFFQEQKLRLILHKIIDNIS